MMETKSEAPFLKLTDAAGWGWLVAFYLGLAIVTGAVSFFVRPMKIEQAAAYQKKVWTSFQERGAAAKEDYVFGSNSTRLLMPTLMRAVTALGLSWEQAFSLLRLASIIASYLLFHWYLRGWFPDSLAMLGTLFMAATLPLTFNNYFEFPTDFPEIIVFTLGLWCIREGHHRLLYLVIFVGTLNRETTAFLPLIFFLCLFELRGIRRWFLPVTIAGLCWLVPLALLRWQAGTGLRGSYGDSLAHNLPGLAHFFTNLNPYNNYLFYLYLFGVFWVLPLAHWRRQPPLLRRMLLSLPVFILIYVFFGGYLDEPREIVNLYPLLVPAGIFALFGRPQLTPRDASAQMSDSSSPVSCL